MGDADQRVREAAYFLWREEGCPEERRIGIGGRRNRWSKLKTLGGRHRRRAAGRHAKRDCGVPLDIEAIIRALALTVEPLDRSPIPRRTRTEEASQYVFSRIALRRDFLNSERVPRLVRPAGRGA
jgi:hypothetical protein